MTQIEVLIEGKSKVVMGLDFYECDENVRVNFYKVEGQCFDYYKVKKQFLEMLALQI